MARFSADLRSRLNAQPGFRTLSSGQQALLSRVADLVIPRTDTPGALDVQVPQLIDLLLTEWYDDVERSRLLMGLDAIDGSARAAGHSSLVAAPEEAQRTVLAALDAARGTGDASAVGFRDFKALIVFGYFTSERVTKDVLRTRMFFARYDGDVPVDA